MNNVYNITDYGVTSELDIISKSDGSINSGISILDSPSGSFTQEDVGKAIVVYGARNNASDSSHRVRITTVNSPTQITVSSNATATVSDAEFIYYTDDTKALEEVKKIIPTSGGTIFYPGGEYMSLSHRVVHRHNLSIEGESKESTILKTPPNTNTIGLEVSGYRNVGWDRTNDGMVPYMDVMNEGQGWIQPKDPADLDKFKVGDAFMLVAGSSYFDQEFGEFNIVKSKDATKLYLKWNLGRPYGTDKSTWSGLLMSDFTAASTVGETSVAHINAQLTNNLLISIGNDLFRVFGAAVANAGGGYDVTVNNIKSTNSTDVIPSGTKVYKSRAIFLAPQTSLNTTVKNISIHGEYNAVRISNSIGMHFDNCYFKWNGGTGSGGIWLDGDGGRDAKFTNCHFDSYKPKSAQPARSFTGMSFDNCLFTQCGIDFSEFNQDCEVVNCDFHLHKVDGIDAECTAISTGKTTSNIRVHGNKIWADGMDTVIASSPDILGYNAVYCGSTSIKDNIIHANNVGIIISVGSRGSAEISGNKMFGSCQTILSATGAILDQIDDIIVSGNNKQLSAGSYINVHHNSFVGYCDRLSYGRIVNAIFEDNYFHILDEYSKSDSIRGQGNILWDSKNSPNDEDVEILIFRNNIFRHWHYTSRSFNFNFNKTINVDISNNRFIDAVGEATEPNFIHNLYDSKLIHNKELIDMIKRFIGSTVDPTDPSEPTDLNILDYSPAVWLDAQDEGTVTLVDDKVSIWEDKANGNDAIQNDESMRPLYGVSAISNGFPSIQITDDGGVGLELTSSIPISEIIIVTSYKTGVESSFDDYSMIISNDRGGSETRVMGSSGNNYLHPSGVLTNQMFKNNNETSSNIVLPLPLTVCNLRFTQNTVRWFLLKDALATGRSFMGFTGEIILFENQLASQDRTDIINYLMQKWGI